MVELQIVVLAVAGSSPVGHPSLPTGREPRFDYPRAAPSPSEAISVEPRRMPGIIPSVTLFPPTGRERGSNTPYFTDAPCAIVFVAYATVGLQPRIPFKMLVAPTHLLNGSVVVRRLEGHSESRPGSVCRLLGRERPRPTRRSRNTSGLPSCAQPGSRRCRTISLNPNPQRRR